MSYDILTLIPILTVFVVAAVRLMPSMSRINLYLNNINYGKASIDIIYQDIKETCLSKEDPDEYCNVKKERHKVTNNCKQMKITLDNIFYKYPNTNEIVLNGLSLTIPINDTVAFVGPSGGGKTTLADIILGILTPQNGHIFWNDIDVHQNKDMWSKKLGYIPQSIYLTDDTIQNNIGFGIKAEKIDVCKVWDALDKACLKEFVMGLPDGLHTIVGEKGVRLSGGQKQRIGIARALYNNPEILVLDEATSALDTNTESAIMESIDSLKGNKTIIIIAHRISTTKNCSSVYKIEAGKAELVR